MRVKRKRRQWKEGDWPQAGQTASLNIGCSGSVRGCLVRQGGPESDQYTFVYGSELVDLSCYVVWDNDTFAVVDELLVVRSCGISTLVGGGVSGIGDLAHGANKFQSWTIFHGSVMHSCIKKAISKFPPHHRFQRQSSFWQLPQCRPHPPHLIRRDQT